MKHITVIAAIGITFILNGCSRTDQASDTEGGSDKPPGQGAVVRGLRCTLSADKSIVAPDGPVTLTFRLHNETDEAIRFVFAKGRHDPWGSAAPVLTDPNGREVDFIWPVPEYEGALRKVLSIIVIPPHEAWETIIVLRPGGSDWMDWQPGAYVCRVRFESKSPAEWLAGEGLDYRFTPIGLEAIREAGDEPFWAGVLVSEPIEFTCSETSQPSDTESPPDTPATHHEAVRGLRCTLSADKSIVAPDETVTLTFRLHNETDEAIRFVFAKGRHDLWGSAAPVLTDSNGQEVRLGWPIPAYVGAEREVLSIVVIPAHGAWETGIPLRASDELMLGQWSLGTYVCRVRLEAKSPAEWLEPETARHPRLTPFGLEAIRAAADKPFWAGELVSAPIEFACR